MGDIYPPTYVNHWLNKTPTLKDILPILTRCVEDILLWIPASLRYRTKELSWLAQELILILHQHLPQGLSDKYGSIFEMGVLPDTSKPGSARRLVYWYRLLKDLPQINADYQQLHNPPTQLSFVWWILPRLAEAVPGVAAPVPPTCPKEIFIKLRHIHGGLCLTPDRYWLDGHVLDRLLEIVQWMENSSLSTSQQFYWLQQSAQFILLCRVLTISDSPIQVGQIRYRCLTLLDLWDSKEGHAP